MRKPWYLDSGCSRHMTGDKSLFQALDRKRSGNVTFGDNSKGVIQGIGIIGNNTKTLIKHVLFVEGLKHNLLSISQLCDKGFRVCFDAHACHIIDSNTNKVAYIGKRHENVYVIYIEEIELNNESCLIANDVNDSWLWHRRLGHASMKTLSKLVKNDLVIGLPKLNFNKNKICDACQFGKQVKSSFKPKNLVSTTRPLELLHIDLFGPMDVISMGGKSYGFVIVDDYSRFTWVYFLTHKDDALQTFINHCKKIQNEKGLTLVNIRSDHGGEFESHGFESFCNKNGYSHNFSALRTPQQNGVVERKNRTLKEMARTMLCENNLPKYFWGEAINTACYILNRVSIRPLISKTPYELYKKRKPNVSHLRSFGCKCFVLNNGKHPIGKMDAKSDEAILMGYALNSKAYRVFNKTSLVVEESIHVVFDETDAAPRKVAVNDDADFEEPNNSKDKEPREKEIETSKDDPPLEDLQRKETQHDDLPKAWKNVKDHPLDQVIGDPAEGVRTRRALMETCEHEAYISQIEPKNFKEAETDEQWINAMQEELGQFKRNKVMSVGF